MPVISHSFDSYDEAARAVDALERAGIPHSEITLISGDRTRTDANTAEGAQSGAGTGATIGTVVGGGAGLLAGIGALAIPGVGPLVAAGWLVAALTGAGVGAAAGGLLGSLKGAGIDETEARGYAEHIGRGGTLVSVRTSDEMGPQARSILKGGTSAYAGTAGAVGSSASTTYTQDAGRGVADNPLTRAADDTFGTNVSRERPHQSDGTAGNPPGTMASRGVDRTLGTNISGANPGHESAVSGPNTRVPGSGGVADDTVTRATDDAFGTNISGERSPLSAGTPGSLPATMTDRGADRAVGSELSGANTTHTSLGSGSSADRETARSGATDNPITRAADDAFGTNVSGERPNQSDGTPANPKGTMVSRGVDEALDTNLSGANPANKR